jgi:endonuclease/exonuclease/phosphatase family metal-dependent hydrolase
MRRDSAWKLDASVEPQFVDFSVTGPWYRFFDEADGISGKGIQRIAITDGGRRVAVLNTHLQAQYPGREYAEVRSAQIDQLVGHSRQPGADVTLVAGDLNTRSDETGLYGALTSGLTDLTAEFRRACGCGTLASADRTQTAWIDYVLARVSGTMKIDARMDLIRNHGIDDPYSDHHGIWMQVDIAR